MLPARVLCVLPVLLAAACLSQARAMVGVEGKLWRPEVETRVKSTSGGVDGTTVSLEGDLDMDATADVPCLKLWLGESSRLTFSFMQIELSGDGRPDLDVSFGGETFSTALDAESELESTVYRVAWEYAWQSGRNFRLSTIVGVEVFDTKVSLENSAVGSEQEEFVAPMPILGVTGEVGLPWGLAFYGEVSGLYLGYGNFEGGFIDWEAGLRFNLMEGRFYAMAGYRELRVDAEDGDDRVKVEFKGFTFGAGLKF